MIEALYIHIPFCDKICTYCDFSKVYYEGADKTGYLSALKIEFELYCTKIDMSGIKTVYFGGGTPSSLNLTELTILLTTFATVITQAKEITFEANPESLTLEKLQLLKKYGINRISMGVQTFAIAKLESLGRNHTPIQVSQAVQAINQVGIINYSMDLIYALPKQTVIEVISDLEQIIALNPTHISAYALIIEPHTALYLAVEAEKVAEVAEEIQEKMYNLIRQTLAKAGYIQYETSNWAKTEQFISHHNSSYWTGKQYIGLGLGSHGYINNVRISNTKAITKYQKQLAEGNVLPVTQRITIDTKAKMEEMLFLGLRLTKGVNRQEFFEKFGETIETIFGPKIQKHIDCGHLLLTESAIFLSMDAVFISNEILSDFLLDDN
ncbi:MAG: radical SAM family heme chaperone HemW [Culicoidibacterales bacterium]